MESLPQSESDTPQPRKEPGRIWWIAFFLFYLYLPLALFSGYFSPSNVIIGCSIHFVLALLHLVIEEVNRLQWILDHSPMIALIFTGLAFRVTEVDTRFDFCMQCIAIAFWIISIYAYFPPLTFFGSKKKQRRSKNVVKTAEHNATSVLSDVERSIFHYSPLITLTFMSLSARFKKCPVLYMCILMGCCFTAFSIGFFIFGEPKRAPKTEAELEEEKTSVAWHYTASLTVAFFSLFREEYDNPYVIFITSIGVIISVVAYGHWYLFGEPEEEEEEDSPDQNSPRADKTDDQNPESNPEASDTEGTGPNPAPDTNDPDKTSNKIPEPDQKVPEERDEPSLTPDQTDAAATEQSPVTEQNEPIVDVVSDLNAEPDQKIPSTGEPSEESPAPDQKDPSVVGENDQNVGYSCVIS